MFWLRNVMTDSSFLHICPNEETSNKCLEIRLTWWVRQGKKTRCGSSVDRIRRALMWALSESRFTHRTMALLFALRSAMTDFVTTSWCVYDWAVMSSVETRKLHDTPFWRATATNPEKVKSFRKIRQLHQQTMKSHTENLFVANVFIVVQRQCQEVLIAQHVVHLKLRGLYFCREDLS